MSRKNQLDFNTAIITYPSDYLGLLTCEKILSHYVEKGLLTKTTKVAIAQEDPDEEIQRTHFHLYWDDIKRKHCTTKYYDIPLEYPMIVFIHSDKTREYLPQSDLESQLGWDNGAEMVAKLEKYCEEKEYDSYDILTVAHPNIQLRKHYIGSKYEMLRYVLKQKLICRSPFVMDEEFEWLLECKEELEEKLNVLIEEGVVEQCGMQIIDELIFLLSQLKEKTERNFKKRSPTPGKRGRKPKNKLDENTRLFLEKMRKLVLENRATKSEILSMIKKNEVYWQIYSTNYLNYSKLINEMFRGRPPSKPKRNYDHKFWLPRKLYNYVQWLNDWVRRWMQGEEMEQRPKGLVIIGPSRTGKTSLISLLGDFSYFKNIWSVDNWEGLTSFTVMDDMDAGDEGKGLSFCWFKPFFGAQDAVTVTDKFKPKQDIVNGKPLIWINNYDYKETFQSKTAQDYIERNMEIVYLHQPLFEEPYQREWIEGHSDYLEFDPKSTWYYQNVILKQEEIPQDLKKKETMKLINQRKDKGKAPAPASPEVPMEPVEPEIRIIDETEKIKDYYDEREPLHWRKERLQKQSEIYTEDLMEENEDEEVGRLTKRTRHEN